MYGFRVILRNTFAPGNLDTVINQLVFRSQGNLEQFVDNCDLFVRVAGKIKIQHAAKKKKKKRERVSSVTEGVLLGCPLAVLVVLVFCFGCLVGYSSHSDQFEDAKPTVCCGSPQ